MTIAAMAIDSTFLRPLVLYFRVSQTLHSLRKRGVELGEEADNEAEEEEKEEE